MPSALVVQSGSIGAGQLRRPVQIVQRQDVADGRGGATETWAPIQTTPIWAEIGGVGAPVVTRFSAIDSRVNSVIEIRWRLGISPAMRVVDGDRTFVVNSVVDPDNTHRVLLLTATELQAPGTT